MGFEKKRSAIISSACIVIIISFYFFVLGSGIGFKIYIFQNRVSYEDTFITNITTQDKDIIVLLLATSVWLYLTVIDKYKKAALICFFSIFSILFFVNFSTLPVIGAVLTLPVVTSLIFINKFRGNTILNYDSRLSVYYISLAAILLASLSIISLVIFVATGLNIVPSEKYAYAIYQLLPSNLTYFIIALLALCIPIKVILTALYDRMKITRILVPIEINQIKLPNKEVYLYLSLSVVFGIGVAFIPHLHTINPNNEKLGVDSSLYSGWLTLMNNQTQNSIVIAFKEVSSGDRPLSMMLLYIIVQATKQDPFQVVEYTPVLWTPLLVLVSFFLTRELTSNDRISIIASFLSAISFQTLIGIYAGFYANWFALILGYLAFIVLIKYLKQPSITKIIMVGLLMTSTLLAHVHTWSMIILIAFIFLFVLHKLNYYCQKRFFALYVVLASVIAIDIAKAFFVDTTTGLEADISVGSIHGFGMSQFVERLGTLAETVQTYYGGIYANIAILGLVAYWLVRCKIHDLSSIFTMIFLSSALIPLFAGDWVLQSRVLYNIPFQIPASIAIYFLWKGNHKLIFVAFVLIIGYISFHVITNLGYVPPSNPLNLVQG